jgi:hypothetical protein
MYFIHDKNALKMSKLSPFPNVMTRKEKLFKFYLRTIYRLK